MRQVYAAASWLFRSLAIALLVVGLLAVPTQTALADPGEGGPVTPCSQCNEGCGGFVHPGCPGGNPHCNKVPNCGHCNCIYGGGGEGAPCVCL